MAEHPKHRIFLVIEDSSDDALLIRRAFSTVQSCEARICRNLSEAKAYLHGAGMYNDRSKFPDPSAIICDLHIGYESGVQMLTWIKAQPQFKHLPVIILTGTGSSRECKQAMEAGAIDVLKKPARYEELQSMLTDMVAKLCS